MQACTIGISINKNIKTRTRRRSRKGRVYIHSAKSPAEPLTRVRNSSITVLYSAVILSPPLVKPALRLYSCPPRHKSHIIPFRVPDLFQIIAVGRAAKVIQATAGRAVEVSKYLRRAAKALVVSEPMATW